MTPKQGQRSPAPSQVRRGTADRPLRPHLSNERGSWKFESRDHLMMALTSVRFIEAVRIAQTSA